VGGLLVVVALVHSAGSDEVLAALRRSASWLPLVAMLEGLRILCEYRATVLLLGVSRRDVPFDVLVRSQLIAYAVCTTLPAGRPASEAARAAMLCRYVGTPRAAVVAIESQVLNLIANAILSLAVLAAVAFGTTATVLVWALLGNAVLCVALALLVQLVARARSVAPWFRRSARWSAWFASLSGALHDRPPVPYGPTLCYLAARVAQLVMLAVLLYAAGCALRPATPFVAQGLFMVAATVGDLVPGQLGVQDGVFALAAGELGITIAQAVGVTTLLHLVQLAWAALGAGAGALRPAATSMALAEQPARDRLVTVSPAG